MSLVIKFHFTSSVLNMFRALIYHHQEPAAFLLCHHIGRVFLFGCVLEFRCGWVWVVSVQQACCSFCVAGFGWYSCSRCVVVSVWLGLGGIRVAGVL